MALLLWSLPVPAGAVQEVARSPAVTEAIEMQKQGRVAEAISLLQRAAATSPGDAVVQNMLASLLNREGRYPEALPHAQAAVVAAPENARYRLNRGIVLVEHGRFEEAIADFDHALSRDRSFVYGYLERGSAQLSLNRGADAREQWALARTIDPSLIWPDWYEGLHDFMDGRYQDAVTRLDRVAVAEPGFGPAAVWRNLARARARLPLVDVAPSGDGWPAPLYRLLRGQLTLAATITIAEGDRITGDRRRVGEALFVAAEAADVAGRASDAKALYERAVAVNAPRHAWKIAADRARQRANNVLVREFEEVELRRSEALRTNDAGALERIYARDFIGITAAGRRLSRDAMIANVKSRGPQTTRFVAEELEVKLLNGLALVSGRIIGRDVGGSAVSDGRFLHVYQQQQGQWQIIAAQATPIAPTP